MQKIARRHHKEFKILATSVRQQLNEFYEMWKSCLQGKQLFNPRIRRIQAIGIHQDQFVEVLIAERYIKRIQSPGGYIYYFSFDCPLDEDAMIDHVICLDQQRESRAADNRRRTNERKRQYAQS